MGMGFQFEQHGLGLWHLSWDLKRLGPHLHDPRDRLSLPPVVWYPRSQNEAARRNIAKTRIVCVVYLYFIHYRQISFTNLMYVL